MKLFARVHHVLMSFLDVIELLLLFCREQRSNLRQSAVHHRFGFLHRLLVDGGDLRFGLIHDRLNLGLLIGGQIQLLRYSLEAKAVSVPAASPMTGRCLHDGEAAKGDRASGREC